MDNKIKFIVRKYLIKDYFFKLWFQDEGDKKLRLDYDLRSDSVFIELGGYKGNYASIILQTYNPRIYIFEPDNKFYKLLEKKFNVHKNVSIYNVAASNENKFLSLIKDGESSYVSKKEEKNSEKIKSIKLSDFLLENMITDVDLININIEGSEYQVLPELVKSKQIKNFKHLQIQFHKNVYFYSLKRKLIQYQLKKTHKLIWSYDFVWERWDRKKS